MRYTATTTALCIYLALMMSVTLGMSVGYTVDSPSEISAEFDDDHVSDNLDCSPERTHGPVIGSLVDKFNSVFGLESSDECSEAAASFAKSAVSVAFSIAERFAHVGYYMSYLFPIWLVNGILTVATLIPVALVLVKSVSTTRRLVSA